MTKLIGLTGKARAGKTTVASYLWLEHCYSTMAFATPLKCAATHIFGLGHEELTDEMKEVVLPYWNLTPRQIFQKLGTEAVRSVFGGDVWVKRLALSLDVIRHTDDVVVSDVRFPEEADYIRSQGGVIVEVTRPTAGLSGAEGEHASETSVITPDIILRNDGTIDDLHKKIDAMVAAL